MSQDPWKFRVDLNWRLEIKEYLMRIGKGTQHSGLSMTKAKVGCLLISSNIANLLITDQESNARLTI